MKNGKYYAELLLGFDNCTRFLTDDEVKELHEFLTLSHQFFSRLDDRIVTQGITVSLQSITNIMHARNLPFA